MNKNNSRPIQTDSQSLGDIGETTVQLILQKYKWTADIIKSDFGEDIDCNIFIDNTRTNYHFRCQVKSTAKDSDYVKRLKNGNFSVSIDSGTLRAWLTSYFPVLLIIYEEDTDSCFWCNPINQILKAPSKLEKNKPSIHVPIENTFNAKSKGTILEEVERFYHKIQRLDESLTECKVIPLIMPNYKIIPFHHYSKFIYENTELNPEVSGDYTELLPSWMSVLKRIDPSSVLTSIKLKSRSTDLDNFINSLKHKINSFNYSVKDNEWISFIISPIKIQSNKSSWSNELTYWTTYSKINNSIVNDFEYCFEIPKGFLRQVSRRARSWDYLHHAHPDNDIAIQFFGSYEVTPTIRKIDQIHDNNIKGQLILWQCKKDEIDTIASLIADCQLAVKLIDDKFEDCLIAITTHIFDPFIGLYSSPMDWDSFEKGNVRNKLLHHNLFEKIPGSEFNGEIPTFLAEVLNRYSSKEYEKVLITEVEYISGFPLLLENREIHVSRFQMMTEDEVADVKENLKEVLPLKVNDFQIEFGLKDDSMWEIPIYELLITWTPKLNKSSRKSYCDIESHLLELFDKILPTKESKSLQLKDTYEILHLAGEIGFEKTRANNG